MRVQGNKNLTVVEFLNLLKFKFISVKALSHLAGSALHTSPYTKIFFSGDKITSPAENVRLTGMYLQ